MGNQIPLTYHAKDGSLFRGEEYKFGSRQTRIRTQDTIFISYMALHMSDQNSELQCSHT